MKVDLTVNGKDITADVEDRMLLVHFLRDVADLTATNVGCDTTSCGACTVLLDGESVKSCTVLAAQASGHEVTTVEGLATNGEMHPVQRAFHQEHGLQCGFCTPGMVMAIVSLLKENPHPTEEQVRSGLEGNLCRCTGYHNIVRAALAAADAGGAGVIPSSFTYKRAGSAAEALDLVAEHGEDAKFLAGGHSLLPLMKLRLAAPEVIIDLGGLRDLSYVTDQGSYVAIGALTRHHDVEHSELLGREVPLLAHAAGQVGDPQIRHRGTIGGSIAHADPASDLPAVLLALDATVVARGADGEREIAIGEFFQGLFETALEPDELLTEIRVPKPASGAGLVVPEVHPAGDRLGHRRLRRPGRPRRAGQHGRDAAARRRGRSRPGRRRVARRRGRARRRGHQRRRRHPRHPRLPRAPGPGPGLPRPHGGKFKIMIPNGRGACPGAATAWILA